MKYYMNAGKILVTVLFAAAIVYLSLAYKSRHTLDFYKTDSEFSSVSMYDVQSFSIIDPIGQHKFGKTILHSGSKANSHLDTISNCQEKFHAN